MPQGLDAALNGRDVDLGRRIAVEQADLRVREGLGLRLAKPVLRQALDESMGVECDGCARWLRSWDDSRPC